MPPLIVEVGKQPKQIARVVELVDTLVLEASGEIHESSSLSFRTK